MDISLFASAAMEIINEMTAEEKKRIEGIFEQEAQRCAEILRVKSPKRTGGYAAGWSVDKSKDKFTIYNAKRPRLTHLLEKGAIRAKTGVAKAFPHITPAFEEVKNNIETKIGG